MGNIPFRRGQLISAPMSAFGHNYPSSHHTCPLGCYSDPVTRTNMAVKDRRRPSDQVQPLGTVTTTQCLLSPLDKRPVPLVTRHRKSKRA